MENENRNAERIRLEERNVYAEKNYGSLDYSEIDLEDFINETIKDSLEINFFQGVYDGYRILALHNIIKGNAEVAITFIEKSKKCLEENKLDEENYLLLYNAYVVYYLDAVGDLDNGVIYCKLGIEKAEKLGNKSMMIRLKTNLGVINLLLKHYEVALDLLLSAIVYYESNDDATHVMYCYNNVGEVYLNLNQIDHSLKYYKKAFELAEKFNELAIIHDSSIGLAKVYLTQNRPEKSIKLLKNTINISKKFNNNILMIEAEMALAEVYICQRNFNEAKELLLKTGQRVKKNSNKKNDLQYYQLIELVFEALEEYKDALFTNKRIQEITKEIDHENSESIINDVLRDEYKKTTRRLETIASIGRELTTLRLLDDVLHEVGEKLKGLMEVDCIGIGEVVEEYIEYNHFIAENVKIQPFKNKLDSETSLAVWVVNNKQEVLINDLQSEYRTYLKTLQLKSSTAEIKKNDTFVQSVMYAPLIIKEDVIGVFTIQSNNKNAYSMEEYEIFRIISLYVAIALLNATQAKILENLSLQDSLTSLYNRRGFTEGFNRLIKTKSDALENISIIMLDLDYFKKINDTYGHLAGDEVLKVTGKCLSNLHPSIQKIARIGGEEFAMIIYNQPPHFVDEIAETIRREIEDLKIVHLEETIKVTTSVGVSTINGPTIPSFEELYHQADRALYEAKDMGRNQVKRFVVNKM